MWWIFSTGQLVACCCPGITGQSIGCWDGLGDASSFGQGDGRESDRHDTQQHDSQPTVTNTA